MEAPALVDFPIFEYFAEIFWIPVSSSLSECLTNHCLPEFLASRNDFVTKYWNYKKIDVWSLVSAGRTDPIRTEQLLSFGVWARILFQLE